MVNFSVYFHSAIQKTLGKFYWESDFANHAFKGKSCVSTQARTWVRNLQEEGHIWEDKIWAMWSSYPTHEGYSPWMIWISIFYLGRGICFTVDYETSWWWWRYFDSTTPIIRGCKAILVIWSCLPEWPVCHAGRSIFASESEANVKPNKDKYWTVSLTCGIQKEKKILNWLK